MQATSNLFGRQGSDRWLPSVALALISSLFLGACASGDKPKPAELPANPNLLAASSAWQTRVGSISYAARLGVHAETVAVASDDGTVLMLNTERGTEVWRTSLGERILAGTGSDGKSVAVVTASNDLVVLEDGRLLWKQRLPTQSYTAPLVAGERVFVLGADRTVVAFDGRSGQRIWTYGRPGEALVLRHGGVLQAFGDTLLAGVGGRLTALNPTNGSVRWELPVGRSRGTNDVERLVDLVAGTSRVGAQVCARAFQSNVGCVNAQRGQIQWTKNASGVTGVSADSTQVYATESNGTVMAYSRENGDRAWSYEKLQYRELGTPLAAGRSVALGDGSGNIHLLSREDGSLLTRLSTDGSRIVSGPVLAGTTLMVATANGGIFAFKPQ